MKQIYYYDGEWLAEAPTLIGPMDHAFWMGTSVFDGARAFEGRAPDLRLHCERLMRSAAAMNLKPPLNADEVEALCIEAVRRVPKDAAYYIRPMFFARNGFVTPIPESTEFVLSVYESPLPARDGFSACLSSFRRPARDMAPTDAKAGCLYPNGQRALFEAADRGFDNAVILDPSGNIAELATANVWMVKDGVAKTPVWNGTFLNGVTRKRIIGLLRDAGLTVEETTLTHQDLLDADEIFSTGNFGKVTPMIRYEDKNLQPGPVAAQAWDLYYRWSMDQPVL